MIPQIMTSKYGGRIHHKAYLVSIDKSKENKKGKVKKGKIKDFVAIKISSSPCNPRVRHMCWESMVKIKVNADVVGVHKVPFPTRPDSTLEICSDPHIPMFSFIDKLKIVCCRAMAYMICVIIDAEEWLS